MKKYEFREWELTKRAIEVYSNTDFVFYTDGQTFFIYENENSTHMIAQGTIKDVEEFLLEFAD